MKAKVEPSQQTDNCINKSVPERDQFRESGNELEHGIGFATEIVLM